MAKENPTVREIVLNYLKEKEYAGLFNACDSCGCSVDDLFPCASEGCLDCEAGYMVECRTEMCEDCEAECDGIITGTSYKICRTKDGR
jgi:hypothetical protein